MVKNKVGIIGSGVVGKTLANGFYNHNFQVMLSTRDQKKAESLKNDLLGEVKIGSFEQTAEFGDILVLAVKGEAATNALTICGKDRLKNKTIIDTTNPIAEKAPVNGVLQFFTDINGSLMERMQEGYPEAHFVKAFSCVGHAFMVNPNFDGDTPTMFICGNNTAAKDDVKDILKIFGWEYEDMGHAEAARAIEPLCMLWCIPGFLHNHWSHAFKLLKK